MNEDNPDVFCEYCEGLCFFSNSCGVMVCEDCGNHIGLARCYCGWSASGGNGLSELIEMGEQIDDDY